MFTITREWLREMSSHPSGDGWTARQLQQVDVAWPPERGWMDRIVGKVIDDDARAIFESDAYCRRPKSAALF